jgi:hypothetical protein
VVRTPDGSVGALTLSVTQTPSVGGTTAVRLLPGGRLAPDDGTSSGRSTAILFLTAGVSLAAFSAWRVVRPGARVTTVLAPDDAYDLHRSS